MHPSWASWRLGRKGRKGRWYQRRCSPALLFTAQQDHVGQHLVAKNDSSARRVVGLPEWSLAGRWSLRVALVLQVFLQPLGDVLRLLHRQLLQSIPDFRDCAHARTLGSPTTFANPNHPGGI